MPRNKNPTPPATHGTKEECEELRRDVSALLTALNAHDVVEGILNAKHWREQVELIALDEPTEEDLRKAIERALIHPEVPAELVTYNHGDKWEDQGPHRLIVAQTYEKVRPKSAYLLKLEKELQDLRADKYLYSRVRDALGVEKDIIGFVMELKKELADWHSELSAAMPVDFKDWHQNSTKEWPKVARLVIEGLRLREESALRDVEKLDSKLKNLKAEQEIAERSVNHVLQILPEMKSHGPSWEDAAIFVRSRIDELENENKHLRSLLGSSILSSDPEAVRKHLQNSDNVELVDLCKEDVKPGTWFQDSEGNCSEVKSICDYRVTLHDGRNLYFSDMLNHGVLMNSSIPDEGRWIPVSWRSAARVVIRNAGGEK